MRQGGEGEREGEAGRWRREGEAGRWRGNRGLQTVPVLMCEGWREEGWREEGWREGSLGTLGGPSTIFTIFWPSRHDVVLITGDTHTHTHTHFRQRAL